MEHGISANGKSGKQLLTSFVFPHLLSPIIPSRVFSPKFLFALPIFVPMSCQEAIRVKVRVAPLSKVMLFHDSCLEHEGSCAFYGESMIVSGHDGCPMCSWFRICMGCVEFFAELKQPYLNQLTTSLVDCHVGCLQANETASPFKRSPLPEY